MNHTTLTVAMHMGNARFEDMSPTARHASERSILDAVGVMLAATTLGEGCSGFSILAEDSPGPCTVLGRWYRAQPLQAAMANGALAHAMDYEDALDGAPVHPNAAVVPVAMALAERDPSITGAEFVAAVALGCDLVCRMGLALERNPDEFGWYPPPILSTFGAAATASRLLKQWHTTTAHALALALAQATFSSEFKTFPDSSLRAVRDGFAAHAGLLAALLAERGVSAHLSALEGKAGFFALFARGEWSEDVLMRDLGRKFHGEDVSFKPWPSCRGTHAFIEAALDMRAEIGGAEITAIEATGPALLQMLVEPVAQKQAPRMGIDAKFSLPFCIGAALSRGEPTITTFMDPVRADATTLALAKLVRFAADPALGMKDAASGTLTVRLTDGRVLTRHVARARGWPGNPLSDDDLLAKFRDCAGYAARPVSDVNRLGEALLGMSSAPSAAEVLKLLGQSQSG